MVNSHILKIKRRYSLMKYTTPEMKAIELEVSDVILASAGGNNNKPPETNEDNEGF